MVSQTPEGGWAVRENDGPPLYIALSKAAAQAYAETYAKCRERSVVRIHDGDGCERGGVGAGKKIERKKIWIRNPPWVSRFLVWEKNKETRCGATRLLEV